VGWPHRRVRGGEQQAAGEQGGTGEPHADGAARYAAYVLAVDGKWHYGGAQGRRFRCRPETRGKQQSDLGQTAAQDNVRVGDGEQASSTWSQGQLVTPISRRWGARRAAAVPQRPHNGDRPRTTSLSGAGGRSAREAQRTRIKGGDKRKNVPRRWTGHSASSSSSQLRSADRVHTPGWRKPHRWWGPGDRSLTGEDRQQHERRRKKGPPKRPRWQPGGGSTAREPRNAPEAPTKR